MVAPPAWPPEGIPPSLAAVTTPGLQQRTCQRGPRPGGHSPKPPSVYSTWGFPGRFPAPRRPPLGRRHVGPAGSDPGGAPADPGPEPRRAASHRRVGPGAKASSAAADRSRRTYWNPVYKRSAASTGEAGTRVAIVVARAHEQSTHRPHSAPHRASPARRFRRPGRGPITGLPRPRRSAFPSQSPLNILSPCHNHPPPPPRPPNLPWA
jgi:hypothetical protein